MSRGYWGIILATFGWLIVSAAPHPDPKAEREQVHAQQSISSSLDNIAATYREQAERGARPPQTQPCGPREYQGKDDLCAQWKAADAAADASWWAKVGSFASAISTFLVLLALYLAFRSNWIARDTAKRQLRAYMNLSEIKLMSRNVGAPVTTKVIFSNTGQTPARRVQVKFEIMSGPSSAEEEHFAPDQTLPDRIGGSIGRDQPIRVYPGLKTNWEAVDEEAFVDGLCTIWVFGEISYEDIFGERHHTRIRMYADRTTRGDDFAPCEAGNEET